MMKRPAFALLEMLMVVSILGIVSTLSIPLYYSYQIRNDLALAKNQITQGLQRAKLNAQAGKNDDVWSFYTPAGILFQGSDYSNYDAAKAEVYPMPSTIKIFGLTQVTYNKKGTPDVTGDIVLRAVNGDEDTISVKIAIDEETIATVVGDSLTVCHRDTVSGVSSTISITDAQWPFHQAHGDTLGSCTGSSSSTSRSSVSSVCSSRSSVASSASSSSVSQLCSAKFDFADGVLTTKAAVSVTFKNMLSKITFGAGGPSIPVNVCHRPSGDTEFRNLYSNSGMCKTNGSTNGVAVKPNGTDTTTASYPSGKQVMLKMHGSYKSHGWLAFDEAFESNDGTGHIKFMRKGDDPLTYVGFGNQVSLKTWLQSKGMLDAQGKLNISTCEVLAIAELGDLKSSSADFQDDVMLITIQ
jgi:prepilin-type N-terminal cleavage/methylation domain-containing protein